MPASKWRRLRDKWRRELFLRGSPSYRWGVWTAGLAGGLFWIWMVEKDMPVEERRIFLPFKRQIPMREDEILRWNAKLSGKSAQDLLPVPTKLLHVCDGEAEAMKERTGMIECCAAEVQRRKLAQEGPGDRQARNHPLTVDQLREKIKAQIEREEVEEEGVSAKRKESLFGHLRVWTPHSK